MNRKSHWEEVYRDKSPLEVSWYQSEPDLSLRMIRATQLPCDAAIIDVGGGASVLVDRLYEQGYHRLAVLDISARALDSARQRLGSHAENILWFEADVTAFKSPQTFDLWHDRAVFHFLTNPADRKRYVDVLKRTLKPGGHLVMAAFAIGGPQQCSGLDIVQYDAAKLLRELGDGFHLHEEATEVHNTPSGKAQQFAYFRFTFTS